MVICHQGEPSINQQEADSYNGFSNQKAVAVMACRITCLPVWEPSLTSTEMANTCFCVPTNAQIRLSFAVIVWSKRSRIANLPIHTIYGFSRGQKLGALPPNNGVNLSSNN